MYFLPVLFNRSNTRVDYFMYFLTTWAWVSTMCDDLYLSLCKYRTNAYLQVKVNHVHFVYAIEKYCQLLWQFSLQVLMEKYFTVIQ